MITINFAQRSRFNIRARLIIAILIIPGISFTQHIFTSNSGRTYFYADFKIKKDYAKVRLRGGGKQNVSLDTITSYLDATTQKLYVRVAGIPATESLATSKYEFLERVCHGKINLYIRREDPNRDYMEKYVINTNTGPDVDYYVEKGGIVQRVLDRGHLLISLIVRKDELERFERLVADSPEIVARLEDPKFKFTVKTLIEIVNEYNRLTSE